MSDKEDLMTTHKPVSDPILEEAPEGAANPVNDEDLPETGALPPVETPDITIDHIPLSVIEPSLPILPEDDDDDEVVVVKDEQLFPVETFEELALAEELIAAVRTLNWEKPTLIQGLCLPQTIQGQDLAGFAQTGTGKTGVFLITIAHQLLKLREAGGENSLLPKALILAPTRELALQISADAELLFNQLNISCMAVFGGVDYDKQAQRIKQGIDVIVATPGRLKDYYQKKVFSAQDLCLFICDEADRMLDMGFIEDVEFFLSKLSPETQKLLFSATTNEKVKELAFEYLENPKYISANPEVMTPERIEQHAVICDSTQKLQVMLGLLRDHQPVCSVVFANTKIVAEWLQYKLMGNGIECDLITGDLPQKKRIALIQRIKEGKVKALIATDVASRGLHISSVTHVYNFDLPDEAANYVHRIGRTARAGASGAAYSLVCEDYGHNLIDIEKYLGENIKIKTEWFPESYLQIEDKAGNPYKDPEFKGSRMNDKEERRDGRRGGDRSKRPDRGGPKAGASAQGDKPKHERKPSGGPRIEARQDRGGAEGKGQEQQPKGQKGKRQDARQQPAAAVAAPAGAATHPRGGNRHRKAHTNPNQPTPTIQPRGKTIIKPVQPEVVPNSFLGIFKKIFAIFFGKKK
ncbi:MAG TPA: DEAD/DEAH box helicase [Oligoflexus sp.]|uniref:DEAD/DEAH box helicase n=1 Tax=Oligoflexus sp. TaxID=1971216 RepID=UPI002D80D890|nr:DEAD/DEAH box helicase [Oligoflexus sp.]HET9238419.1 DEAD/DEAH box helicase [Oligoflexus sp.]